MVKTSNQFIEISKKFSMKENKKLKLFYLIRLLIVIDEIDDDEIYHLVRILENKTRIIDLKNRKSIKNYEEAYRAVEKVFHKKYPDIYKSKLNNGNIAVAMATTLGTSHRSVSAGVIGAGVAYASSLKYDDSIKKGDN